MNKLITVVIAPTNNCNFNCDYCYNNHYSRQNHHIDINLVEKIIEKAFREYEYVSFIWRGGEPLLLKRRFYKKVKRYQKKYSLLYGTVYRNTIQSNGSKINTRWVRFLKANGFGLGISFDGPNNAIHRPYTNKTLSAISLCNRLGYPIGCISVITNENINLCDLYDYMKKYAKSIKFSPCFKTSTSDFSVDVTEYIRQFKRVFDHWLEDKSKITISPIEAYVRSSLGIYTYRECVNSGCLGRILDIDSYGVVRVCAHSNDPKMILGHFDKFKKISEIFDGDNFNSIVLKMIEKRDICKRTCKYFHFCQSGCCVEQLSLQQSEDDFRCKVVKEMYPYINSTIHNIITNGENLEKYNPALSDLILEAIAKRPLAFNIKS